MTAQEKNDLEHMVASETKRIVLDKLTEDEYAFLDNAAKENRISRPSVVVLILQAFMRENKNFKVQI